MTGQKRRKGFSLLHWPPSVDWVYSAANWVLLGSLLVGVAATFAIITSGNERDRRLKVELGAMTTVAEQAKAQAARANEAAENARRETERLKERLQWRELTPEQSARLTEAFAKLLKDHPRNIVIWKYDEPEVFNFAQQIFDAIRKAGYSDTRTPMVRMMVLSGPPPKKGVFVSDYPTDSANALQDALDKGGVHSTLGHIERGFVGEEELTFQIWRKPGPEEHGRDR